MADGQNYEDRDELRLCPTCRSPISVWATRCKFCGDNVGRPKREEDKLTIQDLGGETRTTYTVPDNVKEALEAFRAETLSQQEIEQRRRQEQQSSWFRRQQAAQVQQQQLGNDLASEYLDTPAFHTKPPPQRGWAALPPISQKLFMFGAVVAGLVLLFLGTSFAFGQIRDFIDSRNVEEVRIYPNKALFMLERGDSPLDALQEAHRALEVNNTPENREILERARRAVVQQAHDLLQLEPYRRSNYDRASSLAARAVRLDPSDALRDLRDEVQRETHAYKMVLNSINEGGESATFTLTNPYYDKDEETVKELQYLQGRFLVESISPTSVTLVDEKMVDENGRYRKLVARPGSFIVGRG